MSKHIFSQIRTLKEVEQYKKILQEQLNNQENNIYTTWHEIKRPFQLFNHTKANVGSILSLLLPSTNFLELFGLGLKLANLILSFRRRK